MIYCPKSVYMYYYFFGTFYHTKPNTLQLKVVSAYIKPNYIFDDVLSLFCKMKYIINFFVVQYL